MRDNWKKFQGYARKRPYVVGTAAIGLVLFVAVGGGLAVRGYQDAHMTQPGASSALDTTPEGATPSETTPAGTTGSAPEVSDPIVTGAGSPDCVSARTASCNVVTTKPESELYAELQDSPAAIANIEFKTGTNVVTVTHVDKSEYQVFASDAQDMANMRALAISKDVHFNSTIAKKVENNSGLWALLPLTALALVIGFGIYRRRKARQLANGDGGSDATSTGSASGSSTGSANTAVSSSRGKSSFDAPKEDVTFADVIGQDEAKKALMGIVRYLKDPERVTSIGAKIPRGVLLSGAGGLGKTLLARATAGEAGVRFLSADGGSFMEMYVGVGSKNIKQLFAQARATNGPCIIFIDEIDGIAAKRSKGGDAGQGNDEAARTLGTLLSEMDGFRTHQHRHPIVVLAATNRVEALDPAVLRAGRFTRKIALTMPKLPDVLRLFEHYTKKLTLADDVNLELCAKKTVGLPAASVENICNEAALMLVDGGDEDEIAVTQVHMLAAVNAEIRQQVSSSPAKRFSADENTIKLSDVIGQQVAKEDVQDIVQYLKDPESFRARGIKLPKGLLLVGPPGEGKTLLARAIAGEAEVPFFSVSGSEFAEMFVGVGPARVRDLFEQARLNAPSIVFIDEIDSIGTERSSNPNSSDSERENTLIQLLTEMDGFETDTGVIVLAATNRPDILDKALTRPGRFDRQATFYKPDYADRLPLLQYYFRDRVLASDVDLDHFAHNTAGFSAASIANVANEASFLAARANMVMITAQHIDDAITRVLIGAPRKTRLMSAKEKMNVAVHEGGHAVVFHMASGGEPIARITIMPRGDSGGHVQLMNDDQFMMTDKDIMVRICMALGGRAAQEMILGVTDTGASSDFQQARRLAYMFVAEYGMSELGPLTSVQGVDRSEEEKRLIESMVQKILKDCDEKAHSIIKENRENFDRLVDELLVKETILGPQFAAILAGQETTPDSDGALVADSAEELIVVSEAEEEIDETETENENEGALVSIGRRVDGVVRGAFGKIRVPKLRKNGDDLLRAVS